MVENLKEEIIEKDLPPPDLSEIFDPCERYIATLPFRRTSVSVFCKKIDEASTDEKVDFESFLK